MANINKIRLSGQTYNIEDSNAPKTVELTQAQYDALTVKDPNTFYIITDAQGADLSQYYTSAQTESAITAAVSGKVDTSSVVTAVTSASTDNEIPTAKAVYDAIPTGGTGGGGITSGEVETMIEDYMSIDVNATLFTATITASSIYISNGEITNVWSQGYDIPRYISYTDEFRIAGDRSYNISALNLTQSFKDIYGNFDSSTVKGLGIIIKKSFYNKIPSQFKVNSGLIPVAKITSPITGMTNAWDVIPSLYNSYDWNNFNGDSWDDVKDDDYLLVWQNFGGTDYHLENYTWGYESRWGVGYTTDSNTWGTYVVMFTTTDYASATPNVPYICPLFDADTWQNLYTGVTYSQTSQKSYDGEDVDSISNTANSALTNANSAMSTANSAMTIAQGAVSSTNLKTVNGTSLVQTGGGNVDVHGDWNENSSGSTSYIKNRPFYIETSASSECALACVPLDDEEWNMSYGCVETYTIQTTRTFSEGEKLGLAFIYENQYNCEHPQISPQTIVNNSGTLTVGPYDGFTLTSSDGVNWTVTTTNGGFCIQPIIFWNPTTVTYHKLDSNFIDSDIARTSAVTESINAAVSGKVDTSSVVTAVTSASTDNEIPTAKAVYDAIPTGGTGGGGKTIEAGRGISVTTGETADTVSFNLPISAGTGEGSIIGGYSGNTASGKYSFALGGRYESIYDYQKCKATGKGAISFGGTASGQGAFSCGENPQALGSCSVAFGDATKAIGVESFVIGRNTSANTFVSFAQGMYTKTTNQAEVALGEYNNSVSGSSTFGDGGNTLFSVGNGTSNSARHNAFEIRQNGDIYLSLNGQDVKLQDQLGGGGSSYSAGTGIDITNDVISVSGVVMSSAVTSAVTSGSTDVVTSGGVYDQLGGMKIVKLTESEYTALVTKDSNTLYVVVPDHSN